MVVICAVCKKPIPSKADLIVETQWGFIPRPLHKTCWGSVETSNMGVGSIGYGTGVFQGRNRRHMAVNTPFFWVISIGAFILGVIILTLNFSGGTTTVNGVAQAIPDWESWAIKIVFFAALCIPLIQKLYSNSIESQLS